MTKNRRGEKGLLRVGIVGCGNVARLHIPGYHGNRGAKIVSVFDPVAAAAEALAKETVARRASSPQEMIARDRVDAVSICTPPGTHLEVCRPFLRAGVAILCEKPLEADAARATQFAALVRRSRSVFMLAFCHRFHPAILELKDLIRRGVLGRPVLFRNIFGGHFRLAGNHRGNPKLSGGGCLADQAVHGLDLFRFLVGEPCAIQAMTSHAVQRLRVEDLGMIHLATRGGAHGEITSSYSLPGCGNFVEWCGTKGRAVISYWNEGHPDLEYTLGSTGKWRTVNCEKRPDRFVAEIRHFLDCARRRARPAVTVADGLAASRLVSAAYRSAKTGRRITMV